jgi:predicted nucleic acid-binding protein
MKDLVGKRIVPFDSDSSALAADLFNKIVRPRTRRVDVMIAAIAIRQGAKLATLNTAHFEPMVKHGLELARVPGR